MADEAAEKQHQATGKRIAELRKKGTTLRSRDLTSGLVFIAGIVMLIFMSSKMQATLSENFITAFKSIKLVASSDDFLFTVFRKLATDSILMLLPIFLVVILVAFLSPFIFGGWNFSLESLSFKLEKLDPIANLGNLFSKKIFTNVIKSMLKVTVILSVLGIYFFNKKDTIVALINLPLKLSMHVSYSIGLEFIIIISSSLVLIILYDVFASYLDFNKQTKMTTQELKDEYKEAEGNTDVKRKLRSTQFALLKQRLNILVPQATVVITNPTHYAVAIKYDDKKDMTPKVIAKGKGDIALQIRQLAITHRVPIYQAPMLARAIFNTSKINAEIKPGLYMAVAIVLSYIHQLSHYQQGKGQQPQFISDLKIPDEYIFAE